MRSVIRVEQLREQFRTEQLGQSNSGHRSAELQELEQIVSSHHMQCYFVPYYLRVGEAAPSPDKDQVFAGSVERLTSCSVLGPDYFLYPNRLFADQTHLNRAGAEIYTSAIFRLLQGSAKLQSRK